MGERIYCGPLGVDLASLFTKKSGSNVYDFFEESEVHFTHKCRTALRKACELLELGADDEVLVPSYNCGSEVDVFLKAGVSLQPYRVKETTEIDWEDFLGRVTGRTRAALVTHYFGFPQAISRVTEICKEKKIWLIEDCAHALFSSDGKRMLGAAGDIAVFSFPKTLGLPDGGALKINNIDISARNWTMIPPSNRETFTRLLPLLKSTFLKISSAWPISERILLSIMSNRKPESLESWLQELGRRPRIPQDYYYDERKNSNREMSQLTKYLLCRVDIDRIVKKRRRNYLMLLDVLTEREDVRPLYNDLPDGVCPLYFPVLLKNRERIVNALNRRNIRAISWWKGYHNSIPWQEFSEACMLKDSVIALPIHQDVSEKQIKYMGRQILEV